MMITREGFYGEENGKNTEKRRDDFDCNISNISRLVFKIESFFGSCQEIEIDIGDSAVVKRNSLMLTFPLHYGNGEEMDKTELLNGLRELHIGEWEKNYDSEKFGIYVLDGFGWELRIEYKNGKAPLVSGGNNAYPRNFGGLAELLGVDLSDYLE